MNKLLVMILLFVTWTSWGQRNKIVINGTKLEIMRDPYPYFKFDSSTASLAGGWLDYLNETGQYYKDSLFTKGFHYIELTPRLTKQEYQGDPNLGTKRLNIIVDTLKTNYGLKNNDIRILQTVTTSDQGCVGFRILHKDKRELTRKQRREQKIEEKNRYVEADKYFKER